jgi:cobalt-zinc-cadmium efflux system protein
MEPPRPALLRHYRLYFILVYSAWSFARLRGAGVHYSTIPSVFCTLPFFFRCEAPIVVSLVLFASFSLLFSAMSLTGFDASHQLFLVFLNLDLFNQLTTNSLLPLPSILIETASLFMTGELNRHLVLMVGVSIFAAFTVRRFSTDVFARPFTFATTCLTAFLHVANGHALDVFIFAVSIVYSLPRLPLPIAPQPISCDKAKTLLYIVVSAALSAASAVVGLRARVLSIFSDAIMSLCNTAALFGTVVADVAFPIAASRRFSFGFRRAKVVCAFAIAVVLCFISATLFAESMQLLLRPGDGAGDDPAVLVLATTSFVVNVAAAIYFGSINIRTCGCASGGAAMSILSDLISSAAVVMTSVVRLGFEVVWLDPFVSLLISAMIFAITAAEIRGIALIVLQTIPETFALVGKVRTAAPDDQAADAAAWMIDEGDVVVSLKFSSVPQEQKNVVLANVRTVMGDAGWTAEVAVA